MGLDLLFYPYLRKINFKEFFPIIRQIRFLSGLHMENFRFLSIFSHDTEMFYFERVLFGTWVEKYLKYRIYKIPDKKANPSP